MADEKLNAYFEDWAQRERIAESMVPVLGRLYREHGVITKVFGVSLVHKTPIDIIKAHRYTRKMLGTDLSVVETFPLLQAIAALDLSPVRVDLGKLAMRYRECANKVSVENFIYDTFAKVATGHKPLRSEPQDVVLYGFGRIGRLIARILIGMAGGGDNFRLRAVVVRPTAEEDLRKRASLLRRDSVHGHFEGTIALDHEENALVANGNMIRLLYANTPEEVDYKRYGIKDALLVDNTGKWRDREGLSRHLKAPGISTVVLTAPGKGDIPNIVYGVNHQGARDAGPILSAASCTTNAIVPILKVVHEKYGIVHGHVESCHAYTNDQNLIDNYHKKPRRGRSAALNMVVTETGAAKAVAKAIPELTDKITGNAIRVPTPNVSLAILNLQLEREVSRDEINDFLRKISLDSPYQNQIDYTASNEVVSTDIVGNRHAGVVDSVATIASGKHVVLYVWYDNEYGYSRQVVRLMEEIAGLQLPNIP